MPDNVDDAYVISTGDVLISSLSDSNGYIIFYKVIKRTKRTAIIQELKFITIEDHGSIFTIPLNIAAGPEVRKLIHHCDVLHEQEDGGVIYRHADMIYINDFVCATKWDGYPVQKREDWNPIIF